MARVLLVSKPLVPPWNDSSKNLARDVAAGLTRHEPIGMGDGSHGWRPPRGTLEPLYASRGAFAPGLSAQLRVLGRLALGPRADLWHFFFAPNPKSSGAGRALRALRRMPTIQTVCSRPRDLASARTLLFADRTIVLSRATFDALVDAGVPRSRLVHVPPAVPPLEPLDAAQREAARAHFALPQDAQVVVYPGDLELGDGAARILDAAKALDDVHLVMACRAKTSGAKEAERRLRERAGPRVHWAGETNRIHDLLGCADVVALPASDLYAKMDLPLVLLESMWLAKPCLVTDDGPAAELAEGGAARAVAPTVEAIAAGLRELLEDGAIGARARRAAEERYHPARMLASYEAIYDEVLR